MKFKPSRSFAIKKIENFIENNLSQYSKLRNFDFGPEKRSNISCISPYVTHGILTEVEIIKKVLKKSLFVKNFDNSIVYGTKSMKYLKKLGFK